ncbi:unnamed protein product [Clonostachys chloroleuca]|uniref:Geranylgeranyl transferase type-2 subunit alpha n=1 Tax=Clonostachys chloroleuca TaxID=1926264 RepID=A0AA35Q9U2_9HYPO|nr:unnamed protein product [Clonostachys chloroleuca]
MASHGVARASGPRTEEQRKLDLDKIDRYRSLESQVRQKVSFHRTICALPTHPASPGPSRRAHQLDRPGRANGSIPQAANQSFSEETFQLTSKLLRINPEYYTVWNVRRRCLISGLLSGPLPGSSPSKVLPSSSATDTPTTSSDASLASSSTKTQQLPDSQTTGNNGTTPESWAGDLDTIKSELAFTIPLLMEFPKCYWIWQYRLWILDQAVERLPVSASRRIWEEELGLVSKMLHRDTRNFHAWGYRRHVVTKLESSTLNGSSMTEVEFAYTTSKINADLSNFSAWHSRSQLIPRLLNERKAEQVARKEFLAKELNLVREGLNVGPEDQSLWFYHQYLITNILETPGDQTIAPDLTDEERKSYIESEIVEIKDLLEDYEDIKWIYEALLEYTLAIDKLTKAAPSSQQDLSSWLGKLRTLDPMRAGRWSDLEKQWSQV